MKYFKDQLWEPDYPFYFCEIPESLENVGLFTLIKGSSSVCAIIFLNDTWVHAGCQSRN